MWLNGKSKQFMKVWFLAQRKGEPMRSGELDYLRFSRSCKKLVAQANCVPNLFLAVVWLGRAFLAMLFCSFLLL